MNNKKRTSKRLSLKGRYKIVKIDTDHDYKAKYNKLFPTKMSSSNLLLIYTLFLLDKSDEPLYGKEMLTEIERAGSTDIWKPSHGTYYPLLDDMVKAGYINNVKTTNSMKFYDITDIGRQELIFKRSEFRTMLIESSKFFSNILSQIYNERQEKVVATTIQSIEEKLDNPNMEVLEMLTKIYDEVKDLGLKIESQCLEVRVITTGK
ncbi:PadR family transcriptional regulator [Clostridium lacusfryxellense]|uniref:PadR family transcriptional regulator n=1 Tax=Clostridium lacusfryxellense TaxID=205328 RepID=UPI001C0D7256|nr:PadR family transcriptional regulator [Clostridium lacusfryxellense]MBU3114624.1 PadR family transcriptional regulator [Clostridium lacusfryxellense]